MKYVPLDEENFEGGVKTWKAEFITPAKVVNKMDMAIFKASKQINCDAKHRKPLILKYRFFLSHRYLFFKFELFCSVKRA